MTINDLKVGDVFEIRDSPNVKGKILGFMKGPLQVISNHPSDDTVCALNVSGMVLHVDKSRAIICSDITPEEFE